MREDIVIGSINPHGEIQDWELPKTDFLIHYLSTFREHFSQYTFPYTEVIGKMQSDGTFSEDKRARLNSMKQIAHELGCRVVVFQHPPELFEDSNPLYSVKVYKTRNVKRASIGGVGN